MSEDQEVFELKYSSICEELNLVKADIRRKEQGVKQLQAELTPLYAASQNLSTSITDLKNEYFRKIHKKYNDPLFPISGTGGYSEAR